MRCRMAARRSVISERISMSSGWYDASRALARVAQRVAGPCAWPLPALIVLTDPNRFPDLDGFARQVPRGSVLIHRHFGGKTARHEAHTLRQIADERDLTLLIAADPGLALEVRADGVHWPERLAGRVRLHHPPGLILTVSAHSRAAAQRSAALGAHGILVSPVFATSSPGSGRPMGRWAAARIARGVDAPVYALGGLHMGNAARLTGLGFAGIAMVSGIRA
ncbi:MAG: thiamine monophosphate synthase [Maricaulis sp.]|nr:thiamine monophosphate synthase [Maricaulis sp.]